MSEKQGKTVPKANQTVTLYLPEPILQDIKETAEAAGFPASQVIRQGIDKIVEMVETNLSEGLSYVLQAKEELGSAEEEEKSFSVMLKPERKVFLDTTVEKLNDQEDQTRIWQKNVTGAAGKWIAEELDPEDVKTEEHLETREKQYFTKKPGSNRGGKLVRMEISKEAAEELMDKAERGRSIDASRLARQSLREFLDRIEESPREALKYILEDRDYYQPPNDGQRSKEERYAYQFYAGIVTKRRLKMAQERLDALCTDQRVYQRHIVRAVGRYVIEDLEMNWLP